MQQSLDLDAATVIRVEDAARRHELDAAVICVPLLMRSLIETMPSHATTAEREAYISAVKDIAIQINGAVMDHDGATGELTVGGRYVSVLPSIVDEWL